MKNSDKQNNMSLSLIEEMGETYANDPNWRFISQLLLGVTPLGQAIDSYIVAKIQQLEKQRFKIFFDTLAQGSIQLTEEIIREDDFLHAFFSTLHAAINTKQEEKIKMFAQLFTNGFKENAFCSDFYELYLDILDNLTMLELDVLLILKKYEQIIYPKPENQDKEDTPLQRVSRYWDDFESEVSVKLQIPPNVLIAMLAKLIGTGLYNTINGTYWSYTGDKGYLTPLFYQFESWITIRDQNEE